VGSQRFLDFDLLFQRSANGYRAAVSSPAGQASGEFALPFTELEVENFLLRFGRTRQPSRRLGAAQIEAAQVFGGRLFEAAFQGELRSCLRSSLDAADQDNCGLRIRLHLTEVPELNDLPWEFLRHPALGRFLALSAKTPVLRYLDLPERIRPLGVQPPLEILAVISSPNDFPPLAVEEEWEKLHRSLADLHARGLVVIRRLETPTLSNLQRWLRREACHILHFIGHGGFDARSEEGLLLFCDEKGRGREITGEELGMVLHDHSLRLAVLNACEGARSSRSDPFAGVAQSLVRQGVPAVVAMQFEISDAAALVFAPEFYTAVADGYPIDAALAEARKRLRAEGHSLEWGTPVLYMRCPDGRVFDIRPGEATATGEPPGGRSPATEPARLEPPAATSGESHVIPALTPVPAPAPSASPEPEPAPPEASSRWPEAERAPAAPAPSPPPPSLGRDAVESEPAALPSQRARRAALWACSIVLLLAAVWGIDHARRRGGERPAEPAAATGASPKPAQRENGVYLRAAVQARSEVRESLLEVVLSSSSNADAPRTLNDVLPGGASACFAADLEQGHKLTWDDISNCR
jgi:hypothetical protein